MLTLQHILFVLLAPSYISAQLSNGNGVVGLGRTLFQPTCCYACLSSLWYLELSCSSLGKDVFTINSLECHASNSVYLVSLAYCMQQKCAHDGIASNEIEHCWEKVAGDGKPVSSYQSYLPTSPPLDELSYGALSLNRTMLVNETYYLDSESTLLAYEEQESNHALYSTILLVSAIGFCIFLGLLILKDRIVPRFRILPQSMYTILSRYIILPALFGQRHSQRLPYNLGYVPRRHTVLVIGIYIALNIIFCAISYPLSTQDTWYVGRNNQQQGYIANRLGVLSIANIALTIMFSSRNTILLYVTGISRTELIAFHRWSARTATVEGLIHGAIYLSSTDQNGTNFFTSAAALHFLGSTNLYWEMGIIALVVLLFISTFSILPIRTRWYEAFVLVHIGLVVVALITLRYHLLLRFNCSYGFEIWLYIAFCVWLFDRLIRIGRLMWLNWSIGPSRIPTAKVELLPGDEFVKVTVWPSRSWSAAPGQYCYLHFPTIPLFLESHPFSVISWSSTEDVRHLNSQIWSPRSRASPNGQTDVGLQDIESGAETTRRGSNPQKSMALSHASTKNPSISFIIRPESGLTRRLHSRLLKQRNPASMPVLIEGPYETTSTSTALKEADIILAFAGGIGVTAILGSLAAYYLSRGRHETAERVGTRAERMKILWAVRESSLVEAVMSQLPNEAQLIERNIEIEISCSQKGDARLDCCRALRRELLRVTGRNQRVMVLVCGPGRMADEIRGCVVGMVPSGYASVQLVEESFAW